MNARSTSDNLIVREFTAPKQIKLFNSLREAQIIFQAVKQNQIHPQTPPLRFDRLSSQN